MATHAPVRFLLAALCALAAACALPAHAEKARLVSDTLPEDVRAKIIENLPDEPAAETPLEARRQARSAASLVRDWLNSEGWHDATVDFAVSGDDPPRPLVRVEPGKRFTLGEVAIAWENAPPSQAAQDAAQAALGVAPGDTARAAPVLAAEPAALAALRNEGYADARALPIRIVGERESATLDVTLRIDSGPPVTLGRVVVEGNQRTRERYILRLSPLEEGQQYSPAALSDYASRLSGTRIFSSASVTLAPAPEDAEPGEAQQRDVIVRLHERPRHLITLGARYATNDGVGLTGSWTRRNLTGVGDSLTVAADIATLARKIDVSLRRPDQFGYGRNLSFALGLADETTDAYDRRAVTLGTAIDVSDNPRLTWGVSAEIEASRETDVLGERDVQLVRLGANARIDRADDPLDATRGWRADVSLAPTYSLGVEDSQYLRAVTQVSAYLPVLQAKDSAPKLVLAARTRVGGVLGAGARDLPVAERFYAGGGGSVRGYAYQEIGPYDLTRSVPIGGNYLLETSIEARYAVTPTIGAVVFLDGGGVGRSGFPAAGDMRYGAGVGVRYRTVAGPIRVDIATPLDRREGEDPVQVYISIGQAF